MKFSSSLCLLISLLLFSNSYSQNSFSKADSVGSIFNKLISNNKKEKIILQTDGKIYAAGEKIWFKAFVTNAVNNKIDISSKNLFADLVDNNDSVVEKLVLNNDQLNTNGAFTLPDEIESGFYWVRCYTAKMLVEDTESIFIEPVYVLNKRLQDARNYNRQYINIVNKRKNGAPVIHFFPERLTGIPGIISTGVLQINDANNSPLITTGTIVNSSDSVITTFTTDHFGLARITFPDDANQKYIAVFHVNNTDVKYPLPPINPFAAELSVTNQKEKTIKAFVTLEDSLPSNYRTIILGVNKDSLCYAAVGTGTFGINIPLNNFPGGISSLLLFDNEQHLLAERTIFINKDNYQLNIKADRKNYAARKNAILNISATNAYGEPLETALSISVQDATLAALSDSIEQYNLPLSNESLLSNWLMRYHEKYSPADIDMLMVTLKSLYNASINTDKTNAELINDDNEKLLNLVGKIIDRKENPVKDRIVSVMSKNQDAFFIDADTTKENGMFKIPLPQNINSLTLSSQVTDKHRVARTDDTMIIDSFNFPHVETPVILKQQFLSSNINTIALMQKFHTDTAFTYEGKDFLKPVIVKTVVAEQPEYVQSRRINSISQILRSDQIKTGGPVGVAILTVPGVTLYDGDISIFGAPTMDMNGPGKPLLVENGVVIGTASMNYFKNLYPSDIDFIEVLRGGEASIYGMAGANGVISVNFRRAGENIPGEKSNVKIFTPVTYHVCPRFFMPDYSDVAIKNSKTPDARTTTIYWNGNFITNLKGESVINFYTADNAANYAITVTGLSAKGDIIYRRITVSRN